MLTIGICPPAIPAVVQYQSAKKTAPEISMKQPATTGNERPHDSFSIRAPAEPPHRRTAWTATGDFRSLRDTQKSFRAVLLGEPAEGLLCVLDVFQREVAAFDQPRHHRLRAAAKQTQQFINETVLGIVA